MRGPAHLHGVHSDGLSSVTKDNLGIPDIGPVEIDGVIHACDSWVWTTNCDITFDLRPERSVVPKFAVAHRSDKPVDCMTCLAIGDL